MTDISHLLDAALGTEPGNRIDPGAVLAAGRRARRRRQVATAGSAAGLGALGVGLAVTLLPGADARTGDVQAARSAPPMTATSAPVSMRYEGLTVETLPGLVERDAHVRLSMVDVSVLPPVHDLDLAAGIASAKDQYLNVQVTPAGTGSGTRPRCADLEGAAVDGDGYSGDCSVQTVDGGWLVTRTGRTADGTYAKTAADLTLRDGSAITAETTNQAMVVKRPASGRPPVVSQDPPLSSEQLARLVQALQTQR